MKIPKHFFYVTLALLLVASGCRKKPNGVCVGYFPNLTHAQALIGFERGDFKEALAPCPVSAHVFNAGPSVVEALFAGELDMAYVGPTPAINAFVKSNGAFVVIAGAANGGAALVVRNEANIRSLKDLKGRRLLTPQLGNTQDVTARAYLTENNLGSKEQGGDIQIVPMANPDQLSLFLKKEADAAWTVEPWVSRLILEGGGKILLDEQEVWKKWTGEDYATTVILVRRTLLSENPMAVSKMLKAHVQLTDWIQTHSEEASTLCNQAIGKLTGKTLPPAVITMAWPRVRFVYDLPRSSLIRDVTNAQNVGFLKPTLIALADFVVMEPLESVLGEHQMSLIPNEQKQ